MSVRPNVVRLYDSSIPSGNSYKVRLLLHLLSMGYEIEQLDILATPSQTRQPEFLLKNPNGRIPVVELSDGRFLAESNAILYYLAEGTVYLPQDPFERACVLQWMFFEQYSHERFIAVLKFWKFFGDLASISDAEQQRLLVQGQAALGVMNTHLEGRRYFVNDHFSIADIALYAYTHTAGESGYDMSAVPNVVRWIQNVARRPDHIPIWSGPGAPGWDAGSAAVPRG